MKETGEIKARDCIILYPEEDKSIYDFLCVTDTDLSKKTFFQRIAYVLGYYIQDQNVINTSAPGNITFKMNIFHDMPLHLIVWNSTLKHDRIYYLVISLVTHHNLIH